MSVSSSALKFIDVILHIQNYLQPLALQYGVWIYGILFLVIFAETGLIVTPFLPGDSLLFATGAFASTGSLNIWFLWFLLCVAAILGDTVNYWIGQRISKALFTENSFWFRKQHLDSAEEFYAKHGKKTIVIARFVPLMRTLAPCVAGMAGMHYKTFLGYNIVGGIVWVSLFLFAGYFFGSVPFVQQNFGIVVIVISIVSFIPVIWEFVKHKLSKS
ncbi:MAG: DedA family protein [Candidatus Woesearchaeota archaeon]|nr:DedA family protein [Candidatus Woesearchaeota archaeon]